MDRLKVKLAIGAAEKALERLEQALQEGDHRKIGNEQANIKRELYILRVELGIVRDIDELKGEGEP
jgi:hypothetical protein